MDAERPPCITPLSVVTSTGNKLTLNLRLNLNLKLEVLIIPWKLGAKLQLILCH